jgi:hypothetical protein
MNKTILVAGVIALAMAIPGAIYAGIPDTSCTNTIGPNGEYITGVSAAGPYHTYIVNAGLQGLADPFDVCPTTTFSGDFGLALNAVYLMSDDIVATCVDPFASGHHGDHTTVYVHDDVFGEQVAFSISANDHGAAPCSNDITITPCPQPAGAPCDPGDTDIFVHTDRAPTYYVDPVSGGGNGIREPAIGLGTRAHTLGTNVTAGGTPGTDSSTGFSDGAGGWISGDTLTLGANFRSIAGAQGFVTVWPTFDFQIWHINTDRNVWLDEAAVLGDVYTG